MRDMKARGIKAESFDIMQYLYGAVHEPLIHALICFSGRIDERALKNAVTRSMDAIPVLRCCFNAAGRRPFWGTRDFTGEDIVRVVMAEENGQGQAEKLLASAIDIERDPQLKIIILRSKDDTLCVTLSHLVCDGAGFKEYLYLLSRLYTAHVNSEPIPELLAEPRGTGQLFARFSLPQKLHIAFQKYDLSKQRLQAHYRLQGDAGNPFFVTRSITGGDLGKIKNTGRAYGATLNDMLLAAYIRVLSRRTGAQRVILPCPVDLRRFLPADSSHGICNLTTDFICDVCVEEGDTFQRTVKQVSEQMKRQKESTACLKSVIQLEAAFHLLPFKVLKKKFSELFMIPALSYSNLGIVDKVKFCFGAPIKDMYLTGAVKYAPYFQLAVSTFDGAMTLSCNMYGTREDKKTIEAFLQDVHGELLLCS